MKDQLRLLEEVQRHDARLIELEAKLKAIPDKLDAMRRDLKMIEDFLGKESAELAEAEKWRRDKSDEMKTEEAQLSKAKQKLSGVKNSKEYMATSREVETLRKMSVETEEKLTQFVGAADDAKKKISAHQEKFDELRGLVDKEESTSPARMRSLETEIAKLRSERDAASKAVRPDVLKKYQSIKMKRGKAIVAVHNGTCRGCNMNIPPQLFNQLQRANAIELCPTCHRIIYWDKLLEPEGKTFDGADGPPKASTEKPAQP